MPLPWLHPTEILFPPVKQALSDGLLAAGGDLSTQRLLTAYRSGIFPWFNHDNPILWWSPDPRLVLHPHQIKISKSLMKTLKRQRFTVTFDQRFTEVMSACASPREQSSDTWIHPDMIEAYSNLYQQGHAHSVECWLDDELVGGLYGVSIGRMFFGESMFSFVSDSSKVALVTLCQHLERWGFPLIDCQVHSDHLTRLGAVEMSRADFIQQLALYCDQPPPNDVWKMSPQLEQWS